MAEQPTKTLVKLQFQPGINRERTSYSSEGSWYDGDRIRFRFGFPEKIGGWQANGSADYIGRCRSLHVWSDLNNDTYIGVGTHRKFYILSGGSYYDITPLRETTAAGAVTFAAGYSTLNGAIDASTTTITLTSTTGFAADGRVKIGSEIIEYEGISGNDLTGCTRGSAGTTAASHADTTAVTSPTLTVTDTSHGAAVGDCVTFSGAASLGGNITAAVLNQEYVIVDVVDADTYTVNARTAGTPIYRLAGETPSGGTAAAVADDVYSNASDTGNGGGSVVGAYQIQIGLDSAVFGSGWGAGGWGEDGWGEASSATTGDYEIRIWKQDNFGQILLASTREGTLYYWDPSSGTALSGDRLTPVSERAGANLVPSSVGHVFVSDRDRHVVVLGSVPQGGSTYDPLLIRWSDQENFVEWEATATTTAGDLRLGTGSRIVAHAETRQQILILTDSSVHSLQYLGPPFTFGLDTLAHGTTILGPNAIVAINDMAFWMGKSEFYMYDGTVRPMPCAVRDYVFNDFNEDQREKVFAATNNAFQEVWWFYPSEGSLSNNRYVVYNFAENVWYYGTFGREAWIDRGSLGYPFAVKDGQAYDHEYNWDADGEAQVAYIESAQMDIGEGYRFVHLDKLIPDVDFRDSTNVDPSVNMVLKVRRGPGVNYDDSDTMAITRTSSSPIDAYTEQVSLRLRGRSFAFRIESDGVGTNWRLGSPRVQVRPDGRR